MKNRWNILRRKYPLRTTKMKDTQVLPHTRPYEGG